MSDIHWVLLHPFIIIRVHIYIGIERETISLFVVGLPFLNGQKCWESKFIFPKDSFACVCTRTLSYYSQDILTCQILCISIINFYSAFTAIVFICIFFQMKIYSEQKHLCVHFNGIKSCKNIILIYNVRFIHRRRIFVDSKFTINN